MSQPLIQSFTKNLSGCSGCGQINLLSKGENVTFIVQVQVEAEDGRAAVNQIPDNLLVMGVSKMNIPQQVLPQQGQVQVMRPTHPPANS